MVVLLLSGLLLMISRGRILRLRQIQRVYDKMELFCLPTGRPGTEEVMLCEDWAK